MRLDSLRSVLLWAGTSMVLAASLGCTSLSEYVANGFKVGHDYVRPGRAGRTRLDRRRRRHARG